MPNVFNGLISFLGWREKTTCIPSIPVNDSREADLTLFSSIWIFCSRPNRTIHLNFLFTPSLRRFYTGLSNLDLCLLQNRFGVNDRTASDFRPSTKYHWYRDTRFLFTAVMDVTNYKRIERESPISSHSSFDTRLQQQQIQTKTKCFIHSFPSPSTITTSTMIHHQKS